MDYTPVEVSPVYPTGHVPWGVAKSVIQSELNPDLPTPESIIKEVAKIAYSDLADWPDCPAGIREAPEQFRKSISSIKMFVVKDEKGNPVRDKHGRPIYDYRITLWNKNAAHDQLMRWAGNYAKDKTPVQVNQFNQVNQINQRLDLSALSTEELQVLLRLSLKLQGDPEGTDLPV